MTVTVLDKTITLDNPFKGFGKKFWAKMEAWGEVHAQNVIRQHWHQLDPDTQKEFLKRWNISN